MPRYLAHRGRQIAAPIGALDGLAASTVKDTSLNAAFREWSSRFVGEGDAEANYTRIMAELDGVVAGRHLDRDELNER